MYQSEFHNHTYDVTTCNIDDVNHAITSFLDLKDILLISSINSSWNEFINERCNVKNQVLDAISNAYVATDIPNFTDLQNERELTTEEVNANTFFASVICESKFGYEMTQQFLSNEKILQVFGGN